MYILVHHCSTKSKGAPIFIFLESLSDSQLDVYARLTDVQLRSRLEPERAVFIAESAEVISRALDAGYEPLSLLTAEKHLPSLQSVLERLGQWPPESTEAARKDIPVFVLPVDQIKRLTGFELTRGSLAAFRRPPERTMREVCQDARLVAVLEDIRNHTNIGAAFRSAAALGVDAVLVTPTCYDPFYRRAIRVSMGTVFQVPWARIPGDPHRWAQQGVPLLRQLGFTTAALALRDDALPLDDPQLKRAERLALIFGTEGDGLAPSTIAACDHVVRIPMAHGVDSLNVAASAAVAFWELRKRS